MANALCLLPSSDSKMSITQIRAPSEAAASRSPFSKLPPELIAAVFVWAARLDPIPLPVDGRQQSLAWVKLSHVCGLWRQIALGEPTLWAGEIGKLRRASTEFLARAGDYAPLSFFLYAYSPRHYDLVPPPEREMLIDHFRKSADARRVRSFEWQSDVDWRNVTNETEALHSIFAGTTCGALEHLRVQLPEMDSTGLDPEPLHTDSLETIHFTGYFIPVIAPRLSRLSLKELGGWIDAETIVPVLHGSPLLTFIELTGIRCNASAPKDAPAIVQLQHLKQLVLESGASGHDIRAFLERLAMPSTVELQIHARGPVKFEDYGLIPAALQIAGLDSEPMALEMNEALFRASAVHSTHTKLSVRFSQGFSWVETLHRLEWERHLCRVVHLTTASALQCSSIFDWVQILRQFPAVSRLALNWPAARRRRPDLLAIFKALSSGPRCPLPELASVIVCSDVPPKQLSLKHLAVCLCARQAAGVRPLVSLEILCRQKDQDAALTLEELVEGDVKWKDP